MYNMQDTITAFATSNIGGAVAVLRISGSKTLQILTELTHKNNLHILIFSYRI